MIIQQAGSMSENVGKMHLQYTFKYTVSYIQCRLRVLYGVCDVAVSRVLILAVYSCQCLFFQHETHSIITCVAFRWLKTLSFPISDRCHHYSLHHGLEFVPFQMKKRHPDLFQELRPQQPAAATRARSEPRGRGDQVWGRPTELAISWRWELGTEDQYQWSSSYQTLKNYDGPWSEHSE